ncbi:hypothetical protein A2Z00_03795 [Candidatus Gottesmanbacteria bacterium RBG_13_45_10]|uniref:Nucleotidyl transferase AbiEii/AbiGii toxin family protein n=1 Tax=Candidatus Gottesmanbacteria bacterium RBG_13_45_10 TaxID=1798370 RepID=A0A1F5ZI73_9BACT|nr:MAG: hypothetical protein A2Z00_03795 [Candidatus Gottesmanbacteria bacterium RBG_13_45_10]
MSKIYLELLDKNRQTLFQKLSAFVGYGYLAGGTALALQINHRKSVDFDVFVEKPIKNALHLAIKKVFGPQNYEVNTEDQLTFSPQTGSEVTFLWYYWKPILPLVATPSLSLASTQDIAADKAHTLGRRALWRDYVDLFVLMKNQGISIQSIVISAKKKFQGDFVETQFLEQLSYFNDVTIVPVEFVNISYTPEEIKSFLVQQVESYLKTVLPTG